MGKNICSHCGIEVADPGDLDIDPLLCEACQDKKDMEAHYHTLYLDDLFEDW